MDSEEKKGDRLRNIKYFIQLAYQDTQSGYQSLQAGFWTHWNTSNLCHQEKESQQVSISVKKLERTGEEAESDNSEVSLSWAVYYMGV